MVVSLAAFLCFMCLGFYFMSLVSGWRTLSERYATDEKPHGKAFRCRSGRIGIAPYINVLNIYVCSEGIFLVSLPGHTPLFLPWVAMRNREDYWELGKWVRFTAGFPPVLVQLPKTVFEVPEALPNWPLQPTAFGGG